MTKTSPLSAMFYAPFEHARWQMSHAERMTLISILSTLAPKVSLEIGSKFGGSLSVLSHYSDRVISCDVDPEVPVRLKHFTNVEFVVGPSQDTLPLLMKRIQDQQVPLNFILVDGDHSTDGVRSDCNQLLSYRPIVDLVVLMHDSFNPQVREGIRTAAWNESPYVHTVDIDFIPGTAHSRGAFGFELWGGFGLALLRPEKAPEPVSVKRSSDRTYRKLVWQSRHFPLFGWPYRVGSRLARLFVGGKGALV